MSEIEVKIRLLAVMLKRFFNTLTVLPVKVLTAFRIIVPYENALHRLVLWTTGVDAIDFATSGGKIFCKVPVGQIWIPESFYGYITTGTTARITQFKILRARGYQGYCLVHEPVAPAQLFTVYRGIDFSTHQWLYSGDQLILQVSTGNAGDKGAVDMQIRVLRVGDDF